MVRLAVAFTFLTCGLALGLLSHPSPALAEPCYVVYYCNTDNVYATSIATGTGTDCTTADADLTSKLKQLAGTSCNLQKVITRSCYQTETGQYQVEGYATYSPKERYCANGG